MLRQQHEYNYSHAPSLPSPLQYSPVQPVEWTLPPAIEPGDPSKIRYLQGGAVLRVRSVQLEDVVGGGTITCRAEGVGESTATLTVRGERSLYVYRVLVGTGSLEV